jgi:hypothetical protein
MAQSIQQLPLGKPSSSLPWRKIARHTLDSSLDAMGARKLAIAFDLAVLALHACEDAMGFHGGSTRSGTRR